MTMYCSPGVKSGDEAQALGEVLRFHAESTVHIGEFCDDRQRIAVRRRFIWSDTKRALRRSSFNPHIGLDIKFIGEDAQDEGGPLREFFRLLWVAISRDKCIFNGPEEAMSLAHNMVALSDGDYDLVGKVVSLALVYGGGGPHFFSEGLTSYMFNEPITTDFLHEVPDCDVQANIRKVSPIPWPWYQP
jgi:hypothetical protein